MILTCPACATRYRVADQEFEGSTGRTVRCANCGHLWYEKASAPDASQPVKPATVASDAIGGEPVMEPAVPSIPRLDIPPRLPPPRTRSLGSGITTLGVLLAAIIIAGIFVRDHFAADRSPVVQTHAAAEQPTPTPGTGLVIRKITPTRTADGLVVDGEIANPGNVPRNVPRLRVALQDSAEKEVQFKTVDPPKSRLQPGEVVHFETPFAHPADAATGVVVTFASS